MTGTLTVKYWLNYLVPIGTTTMVPICTTTMVPIGTRSMVPIYIYGEPLKPIFLAQRRVSKRPTNLSKPTAEPMIQLSTSKVVQASDWSV